MEHRPWGLFIIYKTVAIIIINKIINNQDKEEDKRSEEEEEEEEDATKNNDNDDNKDSDNNNANTKATTGPTPLVCVVVKIGLKLLLLNQTLEFADIQRHSTKSKLTKSVQCILCLFCNVSINVLYMKQFT